MQIILETAVEHGKAVPAIDVHRACSNCAITFWVMNQFLHFLGAARGWTDIRDPIAVFRIIHVRFLGSHFNGDSFQHLQAITLNPDDFARIIGHAANIIEAYIH